MCYMHVYIYIYEGAPRLPPGRSGVCSSALFARIAPAVC